MRLITPPTRSQHGSDVDRQGARPHRDVDPEGSDGQPAHCRAPTVADPVTHTLLPPLMAEPPVELDHHTLVQVSDVMALAHAAG